MTINANPGADKVDARILASHAAKTDFSRVEALAAAETLCRENAITSFATYDTEPLTFEVRVISPLARQNFKSR